jgi:hypothetical protein
MRRIAIAVIFMIAVQFLAGGAHAQEDDLNELARYAIDASGELSLISGVADPTHEDLWIQLVVLLPTDYIEQYLYEFVVFESEDTLAYVSELEEDVWEFGVVIDDDPERALTIIHEFGHILALNNTQYDTYPTVLQDRTGALTEDEYNAALNEDMFACSTIAFEDGCPTTDAYLLLFTEAFWTPDAVEMILYEELDDSATYFFDENPDGFVSEYAATNPIEDFAESFSYFVGLDDEMFPVDGNEYMLDAKVLWFEQFPEIVDMRESIRAAADANDITFVFGEDSNYF